MPVFTAAPLPLVYGWRTTRAPARAARSPVASREPSSTTRISLHSASARRLDTTSPIASSSFNAGITMETLDGSAKQALHDTVPGDLPRARESCLAELRGTCAIGGETDDCRTDGGGLRRTHEPILIVDHEFQRSTGIGRGDHGLCTEERFERHVTVVFVERSIDDSKRSGVEIDQRFAADRAG